MVEDVPHLVGHRRRDTLCALTRIAMLFALALPMSAGGKNVAAQPAPLETPAPIDSQLEAQRTIILNLEDSTETRIGQAIAMLSVNSKQAIDNAVNLLGTGDEPSTKIVMCRAIVRMADDTGRIPDDRLVDPLLAMLDHPNENVLEAASEALACFDSLHVFKSLRLIVDQAETKLPKRRAAVSAMSSNTNRRDVISLLIQLLDSTDDVRPLVLDALSRVASPGDGSVQAWKSWWQQQKSLSETEWLQNQLHQKSQRLGANERAFREFRKSAQTQQSQLANRLGEALSAQYRLTNPKDKDALVLNWLEDATTATRLVASRLVAEQISEGNMPADTIREALRKRYNDPSPAVRKSAIEVVGALNDPADAAPMLARLQAEEDSSVRETILSMLGKLRNADAIVPLIDEITDKDAPEQCVAAAAESLAALASRNLLDDEHVNRSIEPLRKRYALVNDSSNRLKVSLLKAMSAIGSSEFEPEFEANLSASDPELLLQAIRGVAIVRHVGQLSRLSELTAHPDARVRQRAIAALGTLGTIADINTVAGRLDGNVEKVDGPRQQAWLAFESISARCSIADRIEIASKLEAFPNLLAEYLAELEEAMANANPPHPRLAEIQGQLAKTYVGLGRNVEALPYWRKYYANSADRDESTRMTIAFGLLQCSLSCDKTEGIKELFMMLSKAPVDTVELVQKEAIKHLLSLAEAKRIDELQVFSNLLRDMPLESYPLIRSHLDASAIVGASTNGVPSKVSNG